MFAKCWCCCGESVRRRGGMTWCHGFPSNDDDDDDDETECCGRNREDTDAMIPPRRNMKKKTKTRYGWRQWYLVVESGLDITNETTKDKNGWCWPCAGVDATPSSLTFTFCRTMADETSNARLVHEWPERTNERTNERIVPMGLWDESDEEVLDNVKKWRIDQTIHREYCTVKKPYWRFLPPEMVQKSTRYGSFALVSNSFLY